MTTDGRLPATGKPSHYDLSYNEIDLQNFTFQGVVSITVTALVSIGNSITLHALDLYLTSAKLKTKDGCTKEAMEFRYHKRNQTVEIIMDDFTWENGEVYTLTIAFHNT